MTIEKGACPSGSVRLNRVTFESWIPQSAATTGAAALRHLFMLSEVMSITETENILLGGIDYETDRTS